ncbi:hypothetical protein NP590_02210 [Methylomonas sp. SURF-2]|uniref:RND efflux pump membrane fusion protein barrel-sandwich domain-containing protein n=1 Tax=Methylomonas subterranea TaxID=2952225 RepID=A0ABT1TBT3_9GAMM|nr:hypothetical protein [Methylomonas sp. SURF-2]MCQ8102906.1 hypothetical protein [Methylomonas sp. SURF-2]
MHPLIPLAGLIFLLYGSLPQATVDDDDISPPAPAQALRQSAGIVTQTLQANARQPEFSAHGSVIDLQPLLALRQQFLAAQALRDSAQARYQEADANLSRTRHLHQQDIVSTRRLQEQQAQWRNDKANLSTSAYQQQTILAGGRLQWGEVLTDWFTRADNPQAEQFLHHRAQLLQISLPANSRLPASTRVIAVDEHGRRERAVGATLVSPAPQVDPITQGERYFFRTDARRLPFGARISAWIADDSPGTDGVIIPERAVVWHLGQAFVYIKAGDGEFTRRPLAESPLVDGGYFAAEGFKAGEEIVTTGAQTLLSQELKNLIPSEDDD